MAVDQQLQIDVARHRDGLVAGRGVDHLRVVVAGGVDREVELAVEGEGRAEAHAGIDLDLRHQAHRPDDKQTLGVHRHQDDVEHFDVEVGDGGDDQAVAPHLKQEDTIQEEAGGVTGAKAHEALQPEACKNTRLQGDAGAAATEAESVLGVGQIDFQADAGEAGLVANAAKLVGVVETDVEEAGETVGTDIERARHRRAEDGGGTHAGGQFATDCDLEAVGRGLDEDLALDAETGHAPDGNLNEP